ncbi:MAG: FecR domain-containing protein, partial [Chitinophagaceae bacterium]|nr:FecR domain-containing protein [Chitinophagaceae bacterium]
MTRHDIIILIDKQIRKAISDAEEQQLVQWLQEVNIDEFTETVQSMGAELNAVPQAFRERLEAKVDEIERLDQEEESLLPKEEGSLITDEEEGSLITMPAHRERSRKPLTIPADRIQDTQSSRFALWFRYAAAILIIFGIGAYLWNTLQKNKPLITQIKPVPVKNDILPGSNKALLTLADGSTITLDSAANGQLATQGNSKIIKKDGVISYSVGQPIPSHGGVVSPNGGTGVGSVQRLSYNTMSTPKGGQYQLTLADGTRVWLNAASSITYPTAFNNKIREVSITGEAYFDVAKNKSQPFIVKTNEEQVTVLGTEFNINAYPDEISKTSLINGSVKIGAQILQPGEAFINNKIIKTNITQDIAWKNGVFDFNDLNGEQAMRQLSRWY